MTEYFIIAVEVREGQSAVELRRTTRGRLRDAGAIVESVPDLWQLWHGKKPLGTVEGLDAALAAAGGAVARLEKDRTEPPPLLEPVEFSDDLDARLVAVHRERQALAKESARIDIERAALERTERAEAKSAPSGPIRRGL